jgi:hypothetical protein
LAQFIVMFRSRFNDVLPSKLPHYGPQDIERGVVDSTPTPQVEQLLCALLALVLNRKKPVEYVCTRPTRCAFQTKKMVAHLDRRYWSIR